MTGVQTCALPIFNSVTGGSFPARIWNYYTKKALKGQPAVSFPAPAHIGGTDAVDLSQSVPTLDPSLAVKPSSATKKPTPTVATTKKP